MSLEGKNGAERWSVPVGAPVHWQLVVDRGRVYAGLQNGELVCFATGDALDDGWWMWGGGPGHNGLRKEEHGPSRQGQSDSG